MWTNYIKNFGGDKFNRLFQKMSDCAQRKKPWFRGTVFIGTKPLYIECHAKLLAEKIDSYFFKVIPNKYIDGAKKLYILCDGIDNFIDRPDFGITNVFWIGGDIYKKPDMIVENSCIFIHDDNTFFISGTSREQDNFYNLGENHLLMRFFGYIFDTTENMVLHGAVVGYKDYGVFISGLSGYGKSTLSAYCATMGMKFVGDDRIALGMHNGDIVANPIYTTLSLAQIIPGIKYSKIITQENCDKKTFVLDKSFISENVKIRAIIEPQKSESGHPVICPAPPGPILTRICSDYSWFSLLTRSLNPLNDYKKISGLLGAGDCFTIKLSESVIDNARAIFNLAKDGGKDV